MFYGIGRVKIEGIWATLCPWYCWYLTLKYMNQNAYRNIQLKQECSEHKMMQPATPPSSFVLLSKAIKCALSHSWQRNCFAPEKLRARFPKSAARLGTAAAAEDARRAGDCTVGPAAADRGGKEGNFIYSSLSLPLTVVLRKEGRKEGE